MPDDNINPFYILNSLFDPLFDSLFGGSKDTLSAEEKKESEPEKAEAPAPSNVEHPTHYTTGSIEVIDYIRDKLKGRDFTSYCIGNVIKYVSRWRSKGGVEDLEKANVYLGWAIDSAKEEK